MRNFKIYLCSRLDKENSFYVDVYEDLNQFISKYDEANKQTFLYLDVGFIRPQNKFLSDLYDQYPKKSVISAAAKYALGKLISESTGLYEFENEGDSNLIAFLDLNIEIENKVSKETSQATNFQMGTLGSLYPVSKNKLDLSINVLELDVRSNNCLKSIDVYKIEDLLKISDYDLLKTPNLGKGSCHRIKKAISKLAESEILANESDLKKKTYMPL